jgi:hypothetical protein
MCPLGLGTLLHAACIDGPPAEPVTLTAASGPACRNALDPPAS